MIETSRTRVDELRERGVRAVLGNAANEEIMQLAHLECAKWLILTIPNGYEAGEIVASARAKNPDIEIIARAHYDDEVAYITERGANQVVMGEREIARTMLELLETPPAGEVVTGKRWLPDVKYEKYVGMIRRASVASGIESQMPDAA